MKSGWQRKTLGDACQIKPPKSEARSKLSESDMVSFLPMKDLGIAEMFVKPSLAKPLKEVAGSYTYFAESDVLLAKITPCFENGKLGIASSLKNGIGFGSSEYIVFRPDKSLSKEWLYYFLSRETFRVEGAARMSGAVGHKRVAKEFIEEYPIPVPPLPEQQRIVGILDEAFAGIATAKANAEKNLQNVRALFESHLQSVFSQRGEGWEVRTLGDIADVKGGKRVPKGYKLQSEPTAHPYITISDFTEDGTIDTSNLRYVSREVFEPIKRYTISSKDLYLSIAGTIGRTGYVPPELDGASLTENACKLVLRPGIELDFVYYFTKSEDFTRQAGINTRTAAQPKLALERLKTIKLPIPASLREQQRIACFLDKLSAETRRLENLYQKKLESLEALKKSLLHDAFRGAL